jgi:hypothetical protein
MAIAHLYAPYFTSLNAKTINLTADAIKCALLNNSYAPNPNTHRYQSDLTNELPSGNGYTTGGNAVGSMGVSVTAGTNDVQTVGVGAATAGTITLGLTVPGGSLQTTAAIAYNATAATVQAALLALPGVPAGTITVTGTAPTWTVTFSGSLGYQPITVMAITPTGLTGGTATVTHTTTGVLPVWVMTGANVSWPSATFTAPNAARFGAVYDSTPGTAATNPLIGYIDFGADQSPQNGTLSITWNAAGIVNVSIS